MATNVLRPSEHHTSYIGPAEVFDPVRHVSQMQMLSYFTCHVVYVDTITSYCMGCLMCS
jgi:hypothetical protein